MAYFIFLKYLRSLEEFRKNLHVKIPPKSHCANFQSVGKFKKKILRFGPANLTAQSAFGPAGPAGPSPPAGQNQLCRPKPLGPRASLAYLQKYIFFFDSRLPFSAPSLYPPRPCLHRAVAPSVARSVPRMPPILYRPPPLITPP
jgi:hypothetical protein